MGLEVQAVTQPFELGRVHFLYLVGGVARLDGRAQRPALDRLGQDGGGLARVLGGGLVGGVELAVVVAAPGQAAQVLVGQVLDELAQAGVRPEKVLADVSAVLGGQLLELAVDGRVHLVEQDAVHVPGQQFVPAGAPDDLDDVPARPAEDSFELLDDLAVAAHRAVEALEVGVDHEDEVVELFPPGQGQGAQGLGLVALAVAHEAPHPRAAGVDDAPVVQVLVEMGLVDSIEGADAHGHGGELPEVGHQAGVGVGGQAPAAGLLSGQLHAVVVELLLAQAALDEGSGIDPGRGMALEEDLVTGRPARLAPEEVVEAHAVEGRRRSESSQVAADALGPVVGPHHHGCRVPAGVAAYPLLHLGVTGEPRFRGWPGWC